MDNLSNCYCMEYIEKDLILKLSFENETYSIYGNLNKGEKIILKYFGTLVKDNETKDKRIFLNYGYGNLWSEKNISEMKLCCHSDKLCYCCELELLCSENLFFCFMDNQNNWDLNDKSSYMVTIDTPVTTLIKKTVELAQIDEEYMNTTNKFFQTVLSKLLNFFKRIGGLFEYTTRS